MRRWIVAAAGMAAVLVLAAGCTTNPPGTDGDLTNGWSLTGEPVPFKPAAHACHEDLGRTGALSDYAPVDCAGVHVSETYHLGTVTDAGAGADDVPDDGSTAARTAYRECSDAASDFVDGPWRTGRIGVNVVWPSREAWAGGARWFRCDLTEVDLDGRTQAGREGSLTGSLAGRAPLRLGCFNPTVKGASVETMKPVACGTRHRAEFAGVWTAPDGSYAKQAADVTRTARGCRSAIARFARVPDNEDMKYRSGWISYNPTPAQWKQGERGVRCFLWFSDRRLTRSLKNAGTSGLPVN
jgi:hypothetical protein